MIQYISCITQCSQDLSPSFILDIPGAFFAIVCAISHEMGVGPNFAVGIALPCTLLYFLVQQITTNLYRKRNRNQKRT